MVLKLEELLLLHRWLLRRLWYAKVDIVDGRRKRLGHRSLILPNFISSDSLDHVLINGYWMNIDLLVLKYQILTKRKPFDFFVFLSR